MEPLVPVRPGCDGEAAAIVAGATVATFGLTFYVGCWLLPDTPLYAAVSIALLGLGRGLLAARGRAKFGWYALMNLGLGLGFLSKSAIAWVVPATTFIAYATWQRRWRELITWEWWAALLVQAAVLVPWTLALAARPDATALFKEFFVDNILGRFSSWDDPTYRLGHRNWFGKYMIELPLYALPWTGLAIAAARRGWSACRGAGVLSASTDNRVGAWRFAIAAVIAPTVLLSVAATKREIYFGPVMLGLALAIGLWASERARDCDRVECVLAWCCAVPLACVAVAAAPTLALIAAQLDLSAPTWTWVLAGASALLSLPLVWRLARALRQRAAPTAGWCAVGLVAAIVLGDLPALERLVDPCQDLNGVAASAERVARTQAVLLYHPDETLIAALDFHQRLIVDRATTADALVVALRARPDAWVLAKTRSPTASPDRGDDATTLMRSLHLVKVGEVGPPRGRRYAWLTATPLVPECRSTPMKNQKLVAGIQGLAEHEGASAPSKQKVAKAAEPMMRLGCGSAALVTEREAEIACAMPY